MTTVAISSATIAAWATFAVITATAAWMIAQTRRTAALARERWRPWITLDMDHDVLIVSNRGTTGAHDIVVTQPGAIAPTLRIPLLPPGGSLETRPAPGGRFQVAYRGGEEIHVEHHDLEVTPDGRAARPGPRAGGENRPDGEGRPNGRRGLGRGLGDLLGVDDQPTVTVTITPPRTPQ